MEAISVTTIISEFLSTLGQSAAFTAILYGKSGLKDHGMIILIAAVAITVTIFSQWSSVRLNPFISLGATFAYDQPNWIRLITDLVAQIAGGVFGVYFTAKLLNFDLKVNETEENYVSKNKLRTIISDATFTFLLVMAYLVMCNNFSQALLIGIAVALVYAMALSYNRGASGGNINYANRVGIAIATKNFSNLFVYTIGPLIGAIVAVCCWSLYEKRFMAMFGGSCQLVDTTSKTGVSYTVEAPIDEPAFDLPHAHGHQHLHDVA